MVGSVAVRVRLSADTRNLANATVEPTIGVGCGLAPIKGVDPKLLKQLPAAVRDFADKAQKALPVLPPLPEARCWRVELATEVAVAGKPEQLPGGAARVLPARSIVLLMEVQR